MKKETWRTTLIFIVFLLVFISTGSFLSSTIILNVQGESMKPLLKENDKVICDKDYKNLSEGEIVLVRPNDYDKQVLHRINDINDKGIRTKGDNNEYYDRWILNRSEIVCKAEDFLLAEGRN